MILRPESEPISDFQDYTLVAVIAVATHLTGTHAGDQHFLDALAQRFNQDTTALNQVPSLFILWLKASSVTSPLSYSCCRRTQSRQKLLPARGNPQIVLEQPCLHCEVASW